ncbi:hypothetical protein B0H19DRAFT_1257849 [Mycena capillaripes]|nr:hypothetical protein B0H19DRAFT_1257849 [Mycena capillaripes]
MPPKIKKKKVEDQPARSRERPSKAFVSRGRHAAKVLRERLLGPSTPPPDPAAPGPESVSGGLPLSSDQAREVELADEDYGVQTERVEAGQNPVWLGKIDRDCDGWVLKDTINTEDLPKWFNDQKNDYLGRDHAESRLVEAKFFGHPGDSPYDIRARKFIVRWTKQATPESEARVNAVTNQHEEAEESEGSEKDVPVEDAAAENVDNDPDFTPTVGDSAEDHVERRSRWRQCGSSVQIQFEVCANDLAVVKIWQLGAHEDALPSQFVFLKFCRLLRLQILDLLRRSGAKVSAIQRNLVQQFQLKDSSGQSQPLPQHRIPNTQQIRSMLSGTRQRERLDRNPFRATHLMVQRNPKDIYTPHDFSKDDSKSKFKVAITDDFSLDSLINENRAATTALCTANEGGHMMPGAYLISANIQTGTICDFFLETVRKVEARAKEVVADKSKIQHEDPETRERIYQRCQEIDKNGFLFQLMQMDKSRSQYNGIVEALKALGIYDKVFLCLCQFHVVQAILRFDANNGSHGLAFAIPFSVRFKILVLFRALQRCRSWDHWDQAKIDFHTGLVELLGDADQASLAAVAEAEERSADSAEDVAQIASDVDAASLAVGTAKSRRPPQPRSKKAKESGKTCLETVQDYFNKNWFIEPWIPMYTDIGMPSDQSHDGPWNTNNVAETGFKQFNTVFLDNKHNKRLDRLASTILNEHLKFFRYFSTPDRPTPRAIVELNLAANRIWERDMVQATPGAPNTFTVSRVVANLGARRHTVVLDPLDCDCGEYIQTGKIVVFIDVSLSGAEYYTEKDLEKDGEKRPGIEKGRQLRQRKDPSDDRGKLPNDATLENELYRMLAKLDALQEAEEEHEVEPNFGEFQVRNSGGRPAKAKPLQPWRRKSSNAYTIYGRYTHSPRFVKKRGPPKTPRLNLNSLLPATRRMVDGIKAAQARRALRIRRLQRSLRNGNQKSNALPSVTDNEEVSSEEDISLLQKPLDVWHWALPDHEMQPEEMDVFVEFFNNCAPAIEAQVIFLSSTENSQILEKMRKIDLKEPLMVEQLRRAALPELANLVVTRKQSRVDHIIVFELRDACWTTFYHNLISTLPQLRRLSSLPAPNSPVRTVLPSPEQSILHEFFLRPYKTTPPSRSMFSPSYFSLHTDFFTSGFWAVYVAFGRLLGFNPNNDAIRGVNNIKELICAVYLSFLGNNSGVPASLLQELFGKFEPGITFSHLPPDFIISHRPSHIPQAILNEPIFALGQPAAKDNAKLTQAESENVTPQILDPSVHELLPREGGYTENQNWTVIPGGATVLARHLDKLINGRWISDAVIEGYLWLLKGDLAAAGGCTSDELPFVFTDAVFGERLVKAKRSPAGMAPPPRSNERLLGPRTMWFEEFNIFTKDRLIIPIFWESFSHWLLAAVFFRLHRIRIYDSIIQGGGRRHQAVFGRVRELLEWEYQQRYGQQRLPAVWEQWSSTCVEPVPQQENETDCAIHTIRNAEMIAYNLDPTLTSYAASDAAQDRIKIANRLNLAIRSVPANHAALGIASKPGDTPHSPSSDGSMVIGQDLVGPSATMGKGSRHRRIPTDPIGHIVFFSSVNQTCHGKLFPARAKIASTTEVVMEWHCGSLFLDESEKPVGQFSCTPAEWHIAAARVCKINELIPVMWPAALEHWVYRRFPTYVVPLENAVWTELRSQTDKIIRYFRGQEEENIVFRELKVEYFRMRMADPQPESFSFDSAIFPEFNYLQIASHEAAIFKLSAEIGTAVNAFPSDDRSDQERADLVKLAESVGGVYLWVSYMSFLTGRDVATVYSRMKEGRVHWPTSEAGELWYAYTQACEESNSTEMSAALQVVVSDLAVLTPVLT